MSVALVPAWLRPVLSSHGEPSRRLGQAQSLGPCHPAGVTKRRHVDLSGAWGARLSLRLVLLARRTRPSIGLPTRCQSLPVRHA